jgi:hypothetical protein
VAATFGKSNSPSPNTPKITTNDIPQLGSLLIYNNGTIPGVYQWEEAVLPYVKNDQLFVCPSASAIRYVPDTNLAGVDIHRHPEAAMQAILPIREVVCVLQGLSPTIPLGSAPWLPLMSQQGLSWFGTLLRQARQAGLKKGGNTARNSRPLLTGALTRRD